MKKKKSFEKIWTMSETLLKGKKVLLLRDTERDMYIVKLIYISGVVITEEFTMFSSAIGEISRIITAEYWEYYINKDLARFL